MRKLAVLLTLLVTTSLLPVFQDRLLLGISSTSTELQSTSLPSPEQQIVALVNGSRAYDYDLELENIAYKHFDFRSAGSPGANETANWIKSQFESFGLNTSLEPFEFTNWTLLSKPSLIIDQDGNQSTTDDQVVINSFQCEHYSWPTPSQGVFSDLVILPLPPASGHTELGKNSIDEAAWNAINITGKIVLIGREVRSSPKWSTPFTNKLNAQPPAAIIYVWWYDWMSFCPPFFSSAGGVPLTGRQYWNLGIPVGMADYDDGLWIRNSRVSMPSMATNVTIRSVIGNNGTHYNVVGKITGFQNPEKQVIISAHYDTVMCSGFCDNGAGVAGIIELAKDLSEAVREGTYKPRYTLVFVAFTGEELYLVGSANYIKQHMAEMTNITAVINLDCIGNKRLYVSQTPGSDLVQIIIQAASDLSLSINTESPGGSDHESFMQPSEINAMVLQCWGVDLGISNAMPVQSSAMLDSYPLFYDDFWRLGEAGWIHTSYDNSTSTTTMNWTTVGNLGNHIKVAALAVARISPNMVPEFPANTVRIILIVAVSIVLVICIVARKRLRPKKPEPTHAISAPWQSV